MSNALAIASVTAVLKDLLNNGVIDHQLSGVVGEVTVSALPPDRLLIAGQAETSRINLFMYHVTPNQGWRNVSLPSRNADGDRTSNPPLGLNLHYLLSTYGANEFDAEVLLGYAMQLLHETPVLTRESIRRTLAPASPVNGAVLPPPLNALVASELADQVEQIRVVPETMSLEEVSKLWTAIQSHYRPTAAYQASVVLIESRRSARVGAAGRERQAAHLRRPVSIPGDRGHRQHARRSRTDRRRIDDRHSRARPTRRHHVCESARRRDCAAGLRDSGTHRAVAHVSAARRTVRRCEGRADGSPNRDGRSAG